MKPEEVQAQMRMNCEEVQNRMAAYVSKETLLHETDFIERHLPTCPVCQAWHQEVLELSDIWQSDIWQSDISKSSVSSDPIASEPDLVPVVMGRLASEWGSNEAIAQPKLSVAVPFYHYGIAASLAFALFHFGIFEHVGLNIEQTTDFLSIKMQGFAHFVSGLNSKGGI